MSYWKSALEDLCRWCDFEPRTADGRGNNKKYPLWGSAEQPLKRLAKAFYVAKYDDTRPNPRDVSNKIFAQAKEGQDGKGKVPSAFVWAFGQFLDHLIDLTKDNSGETWPIKVPKGDPWFDPDCTGTVELPFNRSGFVLDCKGVRQQINSITSFLDMSAVYGSDAEREAALLTGHKGKLKTSQGCMPPMTDGKYENAGGCPGAMYLCGDIRANEQSGLTALHTVFIREHNWWAHQIALCNCALKDKEIYDRARAIVEAELQVITFAEFLPALLGNYAPSLCYPGYNPCVDPSIANEFSTAAYRMGHSLVNSTLLRRTECGKPTVEGDLPLKDAFFNASILANGKDGIDVFLRGFAKIASEKVDAKAVDALRNMLFGAPGEGGTDLMSLNIQRGRDHGLSSLNETRKALGLKPWGSFACMISFRKDLDTKQQTHLVACLEELYKDKGITDLDLFVGGLLEPKIGTSLLGETFTLIIKDQFERLRVGDRFWFENRLPKSVIHVMRKTKLSHIIKRNTPIRDIQDNVFFTCGVHSVQPPQPTPPPSSSCSACPHAH